VQTGPDSFTVSRRAPTGFPSLESLKADALNEAGQYCIGQNKRVQVTSTKQYEPPYVFGNYPRVAFEFRCVEDR
jgi:hypothetical protein